MAIILGNNTDLFITADGTDIEDTTVDSFFGVGSVATTVYADYRDIIMSITGGTNTAQSISNVLIDLAQNNISLGNGNNLIYGNVRDIKMSATGGIANDGGTYFNLMDSDTINMAGNNITSGNGMNVVYGNMRDFLLTLGGNSASNGSSSVDEITGLTVNVGNNNITLGNNNNLVFGAMRNLSVDITGGAAKDQGSNAIAALGDVASLYGLGPALNPNAFNFASNNIKVGNGNNTIFGDLQSLKISITGGSASQSPTSNDFVTNSDNEVTSTSFVMAANVIIAGNGNNIIYGNLGDLTSTTSGGRIDGGNQVYKAFGGDLISAAGNTITVGNGANIIYGNLHDLNMTGIGGSTANVDPLNPSIAAQNVPTGFNTYQFGHNQISAGNGSDLVFGTMHDISFSLSGGTNTETIGHYPCNFILFDSYSMGYNVITVGNGNDTIYGDLHDIIFSVKSGNATDGFLNSALISNDSFTLGNNIITAGNGADTIYGTMHDLLWSALTDNAIATGLVTGVAAESSRDNFVMGNNTIKAGGGNDLVYGDLHDLSVNAQAGTANGAGALADALFRNSSSVKFSFGNNTIQVGNGSDTIYGIMQEFSLASHGGTIINGAPLAGIDIEGRPFVQNSSAESVVQNVTVTMAANHINAGDGNDVLFGGLETLSFSAQDGTVLSGTGDVGGFLSGSFTYPGIVFASGVIFSTPDHGSTVAFGNDVLMSGAGNDFLSGDAFNLVGLGDFLVKQHGTDPNINLIDWGNQTFTGGTGADRFVESLDNHTGHMAMQGADVITDFKPAQGDQLVFGNVLDVNHDSHVNAADLDAVSTFVDFVVKGEHELAIIFHDEGLSGNLASVYGAAIQNFVLADVAAHPTESIAQILSDVAQYIYQSSTATAMTGAGDLRDPTTFVVLPATGATLAGDVPVADAPHGALILEGHSTVQAGFASFVNMATVLPGAIDVHADTASIHVGA